MKKTIFFILVLPVLSLAQMQFPQYLFCVSWLGYSTQLHQQKLSEFATAEISHSKGPWGFRVDVVENRLNSLVMTNSDVGVRMQGHSVQFPFYHLALRMEVLNQVSSVDCELRFQESEIQ